MADEKKETAPVVAANTEAAAADASKAPAAVIEGAKKQLALYEEKLAEMDRILKQL